MSFLLTLSLHKHKKDAHFTGHLYTLWITRYLPTELSTILCEVL